MVRVCESVFYECTFFYVPECVVYLLCDFSLSLLLCLFLDFTIQDSNMLGTDDREGNIEREGERARERERKIT